MHDQECISNLTNITKKKILPRSIGKLLWWTTFRSSQRKSISLCLVTMTKLFEIKRYFKPIATGNIRDESVNFETDTEPVPVSKIQTKPPLLCSKVSSSHHHQIPGYKANTSKQLFWQLQETSSNFNSCTLKKHV